MKHSHKLLPNRFCQWYYKITEGISEPGDANDIGECGVSPDGGLIRRLVILGVSSCARNGFDTMSSYRRILVSHFEHGQDKYKSR